MLTLGFKFRRHLGPTAVGLAILAIGCSEAPTPPTPGTDTELTRIQIRRNVGILVVGARDSMVLRGELPNGAWQEIRIGVLWESSDSSVISVQSSGVVAAKRTGAAYASATVRNGARELRDSVRYDVIAQLGARMGYPRAP